MSGQPVSIKLEVTPEALWQLEQERRANHQRELEQLQIAVALKVEGWRELPVERTEERTFLKPAHMDIGDPYDVDAPLSELPAYSTDHTACAQAEQRILERGLGEAYSDALLALVRQEPGAWPSWRVWLYASPEMRCRAMLKVTRGKK